MRYSGIHTGVRSSAGTRRGNISWYHHVKYPVGCFGSNGGEFVFVRRDLVCSEANPMSNIRLSPFRRMCKK